jgi:hypothetical protein
MELLDLEADILAAILKYLDHKEKLMAATICKKINLVICTDVHLYGKFKLSLDHTNAKEVANYLPKIQRNFGVCALEGINFGPRGHHCKSILKILGKIGSKTLELRINNCQFTNSKFSELLKLAGFLKVLRLDTLKFNANAGDDNLEFHVPDDLDSLELKDVKGGWAICQKILFKQKKLRHLELEDLSLPNFEGPEKMRPKILGVKAVTFPNQTAFDGFSKFLMVQKKIEELDLDISVDETKYRHNYKDILTHLLNLESLTAFFFNFRDPLNVLPTLQIENPNVKKLTFYGLSHDANYSKCFRYFPKLETLLFSAQDKNDVLDGIESLTSLRELGMDFITEELLEQIKLPQLKKFSINFLDHVYFPGIWKTFAQNNPNIENFKLPSLNITRYQDSEHFEEILKSFPNLKILKASSFGWNTVKKHEEDGLRMIAKYCEHLSNLDLHLSNLSIDEKDKLLQELFPNLTCDYKDPSWKVALKMK